MYRVHAMFFVLLVLALLGLVGCTNPVEPAAPPAAEASLYMHSVPLVRPTVVIPRF